jgi:hypothetical protein
LGAACCAGARCQEAVVAHPSPLGGGLGDGVSDFLVFDMVYQVLNAGRAGSTPRACSREGIGGTGYLGQGERAQQCTVKQGSSKLNMP